METNLSYAEALEAMKEFLERFYQRTRSDDVGSLLSDLSLVSDGRTVNPAAWGDWLQTVRKVSLPGQVYLSVIESYKAMLAFLKDFSERAEEKQVFDLIADMQLAENHAPRNPKIWSDWIASVKEAKNGKKGMLEFQK